MIYFDNAATTLIKPKQTTNLVLEGLSSGLYGNPGRGSHKSALRSLEELYKTREAIAQLCNVSDASHIALTQNASASLNLVLRSLFEGSSAHVITTVLEHNSVLRPLYALEKTGLNLTIIGLDGNGDLDYKRFDTAIQADTKAIVVTAASNVTGQKTNLEYLSSLAQRHKLVLIVDASQIAGTSPIDISAFENSIFCFTGHKGLLGPMGTGVIVAHGDFPFKPVFSGGSGFHSFDTEHPRTMPDVFEVGTMNVPSFMGLRGGVEFLLRVGLPSVSSHIADLRNYFIQGIKQIPQVKIYASDLDGTGIVALNILDISSGEISFELDERYDIATRPGAHCAPLMHKALHTETQGIVRFSFSYFNTMAEVDQALHAISDIAKKYTR